MAKTSRTLLGVLYAPVGEVWLDSGGGLSFAVSPDASSIVAPEQIQILENLRGDIHNKVALLDARGDLHVVSRQPDPASLLAINDELQRRSDGHFVFQPDWDYMSEQAARATTTE